MYSSALHKQPLHGRSKQVFAFWSLPGAKQRGHLRAEFLKLVYRRQGAQIFALPESYCIGGGLGTRWGSSCDANRVQSRNCLRGT